MNDSRLFSTAAACNRGAILDVLRAFLPKQWLALEIASNSGEHVVRIAAHLKNVTFAPSDPNPKARASVAAWFDGYQATVADSEKCQIFGLILTCRADVNMQDAKAARKENVCRVLSAAPCVAAKLTWVNATCNPSCGFGVNSNTPLGA